MAAPPDNAPLSDTETAEKPVREQLKKASIAGLPEGVRHSAEEESLRAEGAEANGEGAESRGRLQRKRSFEEVESEQSDLPSSAPAKHHTRKRSRDSTIEENELNNGQRKVSGERPRESADAPTQAVDVNGDSNPVPTERAGTPDQAGERHLESANETMASPKIKRSRLHSTHIEGDDTIASEAPAPEVTSSSTQKDASKEPSTDASHPAAAPDAAVSKVPPTSGFANTSAVSPFGALAGSKSPSSEPQTSASAFASSGFGSLAGSATSGFGSIGKTSGGFGVGGGFATGGKSPLPTESSKEDAKPNEASGSTFGGALGQKSAFATAPSTSSGFGSGASGFGKLGQASGLGSGFASAGSGFGGLGGSSGGLSTFASGKPSTSLAGSSRPAKGFGAPGADEEDGDAAGEDDEAGVKSPLHHEDEQQDERFFEQELETGEEDEVTEYSCRAKLYNFATVADKKKEWRERGLGILRLNVKKSTADGEVLEKPKARFLMRAEGSHRVVLNTPIKKEIKFGAPTGGPPQGGFMYFMGTIDGRAGLELLQLKVRQQYALELYEKVVELQKGM